jgi:mono/diheme cytochrome c family protein
VNPLPFAPAVVAAILAAAPLAQDKLAPGDTEWVAPVTERARTSPVPVTRENVERGRHLYVEHCATCHGDRGKGDGPSARLHAKRTTRPPHDLTDAAVQGAMADGEIFWKLTVGYRRDGKVIMPAYETLLPLDEDRWRIVQFVRTLGPSAP